MAPGQDELETAAFPPGADRGTPRRRATPLAPDRQFGPYRLIGLLGKGGFGEVWEAEHRDTGRRVALKVLLATAISSAEQIDRFKREGRLAASLSHPHCVYVFSAEEIEGCPTIAMELMPGGTLQDGLRRNGPLPYRRAVDTALQVIDGLEAAAATGVIHRDVKPSNCFVDLSGDVRVGDFGLSKTLDAESDLTATGCFLGTPAYSSPEQVRGRDVDSSSDLYSVGATLYALLTGAPPFAGDGTQALARILSEPPTPFSRYDAEVPQGLQKVVLRLLAKDKSRRYPSYGALRAALLQYSSHGLVVGGLGQRLAAGVIDMGAITAAVGLILGGAFFSQPTSPPNQLLSLAVTCAYFASQEWRWGSTPGKRLLGLRVGAAGGGSPTFGAIAVRVAVFAGILHAPLAAVVAANPGVPQQQLAHTASFWILGVALPYVLLFGTMRRRNGLATLHDLASKTRVVGVAVPSRSSAPGVASTQTPIASAPRRAFGPYVDASPLWDNGNESLLVAQDPDLHRKVWIHALPDPGAPTEPPLASHRPGRLRWLQGARCAGDSWDAFEAPSGIGLREWVERKSRLPWSQLREILLDVAIEIEARQEQGPAATPLSIRHVWVDGNGQTRLLDFPSQLAQGEEDGDIRGGEWRAFLHQLLLFGCEGALVAPDRLGARTPRVPLPDYVRPLVQRLCGLTAPPTSPGELVAELKSVAARPAYVSRARRVWPLLLTSAPALIMLFLLALMVFFAGEAMGPSATLGRCRAALESLESGRTVPGHETARSDLRLLEAHAYTQLKELSRGDSLMAQQIAFQSLRGVEGQRRAAMEALQRSHPPSAEELARAHRTLDAVTPARRSLWSEIPEILAFVTIPLAVPALILAPIVRGGGLLALFGIGLQTLDGRRAGRWRSLGRAAVVWAPLVVLWFWHPWIALHVALPLILTAGVGSVLVRPERALPDLLAGTVLVPRR